MENDYPTLQVFLNQGEVLRSHNFKVNSLVVSIRKVVHVITRCDVGDTAWTVRAATAHLLAEHCLRDYIVINNNFHLLKKNQ